MLNGTRFNIFVVSSQIKSRLGFQPGSALRTTIMTVSGTVT